MTKGTPVRTGTAQVTKMAPAKVAPATTKVKQSVAAKPVVKPAPKRAAVKPARKPLPVFKAPADFKPHFLLVQMTTEKDGLLASKIKAVRYVGRFDREAEEKKRFDIGSYDPLTLMGIAARISAVIYKATNDKKMPVNPKERVDLKGSHRLPASTTFQILMRVGKKAADQSLTCGVKQIWQPLLNSKTGRSVLRELDKADPAYRTIRKASRMLPAAFVTTQMPPKRVRGQAAE